MMRLADQSCWNTVLREQRYGIVSVTEERLKERGYLASESRE